MASGPKCSVKTRKGRDGDSRRQRARRSTEHGRADKRNMKKRQLATMVVHASFPAGAHLTAQRLRDTPPCWPVSGLANATRESFPEGRGIQWTEDTSGE